jgi:aminoglycoside 3-N-acetyltransferase I
VLENVQQCRDRLQANTRYVDETTIGAAMSRTDEIAVRRLGPADRPLAQQTFALMAAVFGEGGDALSDQYVDGLLARPDFWALVALDSAAPVGGITAHVLPMTRNEARELFIYDLAVDPAHQRRGIGRRLVETLCRDAAAAGVPVAFVQADDEDDHAVSFYTALRGAAAPVTVFDFEHGHGTRRAAT